MRVVSMNLRAYFGPGGSLIEDLAALIAAHEPDVVLLQEMRPRWLEVVCRVAGLSGMHSLDVTPVLRRWRGDRCAVAVRPPRQIERAWRLEPGAFEPVAVGSRIDESVPIRFEVLPERLAARFSTRTLFAEALRRRARLRGGRLSRDPGNGPRGRKARE